MQDIIPHMRRILESMLVRRPNCQLKFRVSNDPTRPLYPMKVEAFKDTKICTIVYATESYIPVSTHPNRDLLADALEAQKLISIACEIARKTQN